MTVADELDLEELLTLEEVAKLCKCSEKTVERAYLSGELRSIRLTPHLLRFHPRDVADWIEGKRVG